MDLLKKVRPASIEDVPFYRDQIEEALQWIQDFKDKKDRKKKVLLIIGDTGSGKTILAQLLFQALEYQIIELNGTNLRSQKKLGEFLHKAFS
jgi:polynucleotide 5'-kinase involved in rRNA processing